jgi:hypothetical protein
MNTFNDSAYPHAKEFHIISVNGSRNRLSARVIPFIAGSDSVVYNHAGIPGAFVTAWPESFYHSNQDTPDKVDPTQLHRGVFARLVQSPLATMSEWPPGTWPCSYAHARMRIGKGVVYWENPDRARHSPMASTWPGKAIATHAGWEAGEAIEQVAATLAGGERPR